MLNIQGGHFDYRDIDIQFRRNKPQNLLETAQIVTMLSSDLSRETRLKMIPTIENVQDELAKLEEERQSDVAGFGSYDALAKAIQEAQALEQPPQAEAPPPQEGGEGA